MIEYHAMNEATYDTEMDNLLDALELGYEGEELDERREAAITLNIAERGDKANRIRARFSVEDRNPGGKHDAESTYFIFMERRRLVGNDQKRQYGVTQTHFGYSCDRELLDGSEVRDQGAFHVSDKDYPLFQDLYKAAAMSGAYQNVMERQKRYSMLCVDVDLRYLIETTRFCDARHAHKIHRVVIDEVAVSFVIDKSKVVGYLFQKPRLKASDKDGFHLMYPHLIMEDRARKRCYPMLMMR